MNKILKIKKTSSVAFETGIKCLIYGESGAGKTSLVKTLDPQKTKVLILSAEAGMMAIADVDIDFFQITDVQDLAHAYNFIKNRSQPYTHIFLDSISEIAEIVLADNLEKYRSGGKGYGEMIKTVTKIIRSFRDLTWANVYFLAKIKAENQNGKTVYGPSFPGKKLGPDVPYFFDQVFALRVFDQPDGKPPIRYLQCQPDGFYLAKDRTGSLEIFEPAHLTQIEEKFKSKFKPAGSPAITATKGAKNDE